MQISASHGRKFPSVWRDLRRDWQRWSRIERLAAGMLAFSALAGAVLYSLAGAIR